MRTIYIDSDYKCHTINDGTMTAVETGFFNEKCDAFIEGHRFVPSGEIWIREDGEVFSGEMISTLKDCDKLDASQEQYERDMAELEAAYQKGVNSAYD